VQLVLVMTYAVAATSTRPIWRRCIVEDYGAVAETHDTDVTARGDDSAAIFAALRACGGVGGGEVVLRGPGTYDSLPFNLTSNQVLHIASGAVLQAPTPRAGECISSETPCPYPVVPSFQSYLLATAFGTIYTCCYAS
jgi:polygalacturonase